MIAADIGYCVARSTWVGPPWRSACHPHVVENARKAHVARALDLVATARPDGHGLLHDQAESVIIKSRLMLRVGTLPGARHDANASGQRMPSSPGCAAAR